MRRYAIHVSPEAWEEIRSLPGNMRQRIRRAVDDLETEPRPSQSRRLETPTALPELRRIRLDRWRIVYTIDEQERLVDVLAVRRRPPYDYGDLAELLAGD